MFLDHLQIHVEAGAGGAGAVSFRREKFVEMGGPDGGDGGDGGSVYLRSTRSLNTLNPFRHQRSFSAGRGGGGEGALRTGKGGRSLTLEVPLGTVVSDAASGEPLAEMLEDGQTVRVARGGRGGLGNSNFKSSTNRAPRKSQPGEPGESRDLDLELKLIADVGLVGFPNAGKSTLVSRVSEARPKIADYPFTTLEPQLGVVPVSGVDTFVLADIPGLIEGAARGAGLGTEFLRHVERTRMLLHLVDVSDPSCEPGAAVRAIEKELAEFSQALSSKPRWLVATKLDSLQDAGRRGAFEGLCRERGQGAIFISAVTGEGLRPLVFAVHEELQRLARAAPAPGPPVRRVGLLGGAFDPPHEGHLRLARLASEALRLDELRFVPFLSSPQKGAPAAPPGARLAMLRGLLRGTAFRVDETDLAEGATGYTVDTLEALAAREPGAAWILVMGMDQALNFGAWRLPARVLELASVAVAPRPGCAEAGLPGVLAPRLTLEWSGAPGQALLLPGTEADVSSSGIRRRLADRAAGGGAADLPEAVLAVVSEEGLYT